VTLCFGSSPGIFIDNGALSRIIPPPQNASVEDGSDLTVPGKRSSPIVIDLDMDDRKDILAGNTDGQLLFYRNIGTDAEPIFSDYKLVDPMVFRLTFLARRAPGPSSATGPETATSAR